MIRSAKINKVSETRTPGCARLKCLRLGLLFMLAASMLTATDKGWAMDNGSLTGAYMIYNLQSSFGGTDPNGGWGVSDSEGLSQVEVTFDGSGGWSGSSTDYQLERQTGEISKDMGINPDVDLVLSNRFTVLAPSPETGGISGS